MEFADSMVGSIHLEFGEFVDNGADLFAALFLGSLGGLLFYLLFFL